jgi:cytosine/adenosine deaminase-related metal-dependent hydrolase
MLRGKCPPTTDLPAWLSSVIAGRLAATTEEVQQAIGKGIAECLRFGTTLLGDVSSGGASWSLLSAAPLRSVVFYELLGLPRGRAESAGQAALDWLRTCRPSDRCRRGLSPHAPYSVRRDLFVRAAYLARAEGLPLATHLAESLAEVQLLREHVGPFADFLKDLGVWAPDGLVSSPAEVLELCRDVETVLLVHGNYLAAEAPLALGQTIVCCPRTHAAFGHTPHPLPALLQRGVRVALGTDSLASNPDLDMLAEARFVHARFPEVAGDALLHMLTLDGARALARGDETGSLTPGKSADLVVLPLADAEPADPHTLLWESALPVAGVMWRGKWLQP